ncbi:uncharacterized protein EV154DRAFT_504406 [Mucor mucedo]|uniref:uncharacterized protein n=1 Tax=Mucor mucedo TaxID=29922 RepID=UPI00221FDB29|nr:uncharacterized protein EV154DRAFT_504406 [Mucor mucedo]KAI7892656.1 hypothetical protein EV154DRAFT_504406 [Mucor mucedo]
MSLLLTKTCEYAILVTIQQGRYFQTDATIKIETELDLKLPPSIDDLIPTKTNICSPPSKVDNHGNCSFNVSLVYFVSHKQLTRLRRNEATMSICVKKEDKHNNKIVFLIADAKEVIPQSEHKLDHIYKFVADKGAWCTIAKTRQQLKVGLFYVAMPDNNHSSNNSIVLNTPCIQLRSPPPTPIMPKRVTATNSNRKKKISSILGTSNSVISCATSIISTTTTNTGRKKKPSVNSSSSSSSHSNNEPQKIPLRRTKSSLVDLNIEELANVLKKMNIFSSDKQAPPLPLPLSPSVSIPPEQSYHQIGKGTLQYTFYFKIMFVDHFKQNLLRQSTPITSKKIQYLKKPYFGYSFLSNYNLSPVASINLPNQHDGKCCFQLRGHFIDIQNWFHAQNSIELSYIITDKYTKETVGKARVPLKSLDSKISDKIYSVHDLDKESVIAKVTVRIGLVSGWHKEEEYEKIDTRDDPWDIFNNKKQRHHSQSSVPTLLTSSTTSSTKSSTNNQVPSIQYIQRPSLKKSKYMTSYK